ncbi:MAG: hypothetical protein ABSC37_15740 [Xanthobacteraceae bacterium]
MAYARAADPREFVATTRTARNGRSLLRRLRDALAQSHQRALDREILAHLGGRGAKFTDNAEREIERILFSTPRW